MTYFNYKNTDKKPIIFTAQSKKYFYCRDAICAFVFESGGIPLNPFRAFGFFLGDRVDRNNIRIGNNNLIRISDELWVFGKVIADGVFFEILYAQSLGKEVRYFNVNNKEQDIHPIGYDELEINFDELRIRFEDEEFNLFKTKKRPTRKDLINMIRGERKQTSFFEEIESDAE